MTKATKMTATKTTEQAIKRFIGLFNKGIEAIQEACAEYAQAIDLDSEAPAKFRAVLPHIPAETWNRFERIGRGSLTPEMAYFNGGAYYRLARYAPTEQRRILTEGVEVLTAEGGSFKARVQDLTPYQTRQALGPDGARPLDKQHAYIESRKTQAVLDKPAIKIQTEFYNIEGKYVNILRPVRLTARQLTDLLAKLGKKK